MRSLKGWGCLPVLISLLAPGAARAQIFTVPSNPFPQARSGTRPRLERLQVGVYAALWEFAPLKVSGTSSERLNADPSPLITVDYFISEKLSVGGWWNPFSGDVEARNTAGRNFKAADTDSSFWDLHAAYYLSRRRANGWSIQGGFSHLRNNVKVVQALRDVGVRSFAASSSSLNIWVNRTQQVGSRRVRREHRPISLFGSVGYYPSSQFDHAANIIVGGTAPLAAHLSLSSSVWFNSLDHTNTRVTVGLAGSF